MDFVLIVIAIGGLVMAVVMLILASRASRMQKESDVRVDTLTAMATGSVLFGHQEPEAPVEPLVDEMASLRPVRQFVRSEPADAGVELALFELPDEYELRDEHELRDEAALPVAPATAEAAAEVQEEEEEEEQVPEEEEGFAAAHPAADDDFSDEFSEPEPAIRTRRASAYPFVMTVPAAAGAGRVLVSFDRAQDRSGS